MGPANSDISKVYGSFLRRMGWKRIAVVTDDDAYTSDFGQGLANDMNEHGGTVLYHGVFPTLPTQAVVDKQGRLHSDGVKNISNHLLHARMKNTRVIFVVAKGDAGRIALYSALEVTGFTRQGYAIIDGDMLDISNDLIASGKLEINGIVHMAVGEPHTCKSLAGCPHKACGPTCAAPSRFMNQAYDAVYTLAKALAPQFRDGGRSYLAGVQESRWAAMAAIRSTSLSFDIATSGLLEFTGDGSNNRDKVRFYTHDHILVSELYT